MHIILNLLDIYMPVTYFEHRRFFTSVRLLRTIHSENKKAEH